MVWNGCDTDNSSNPIIFIAIKMDLFFRKKRETTNINIYLKFCLKIIYHKILKYSDTQTIAVIILIFEQCGSTIE